MSKSLAGMVAIVTGASQGIGQAIALTLSTHGAQVVIFSRKLEIAKKIVEGIQTNGGQATAYSVDVCNEDQVQSAVSEVLAKSKRVDILINCVGGFNKFLPIEQVSSAEWDDVLNLNLKSAFLMARALIPSMKQHQFGRIINIGSIAGNGPNPYGTSYLPYGAAKAGLIGFTKHLAKELGSFGITVNSVSPGTTATERVIKVRDSESLNKMAEQTPLKRLVTPEDTAQAVLFLSSATAGGITGVNLNVNAGAVM